MTDEVEVAGETEPASNEQIREMDSIVNAMEADITERCTRTSVTEMKPTTAQDSKDNTNNAATTAASDTIAPTQNIGNNVNSARKIQIRLKYLNDTQKEVEGSLDELLKDFKWRHFSTELSSESRVRLIFNGRVLADDASTLQACGLHDKAVVHCLVHPKRNNNQQRGTSEEPPVNATAELITDAPPAERAWDLENILMTLVSVALTVVWFFRCEYSNMFTATASMALFGLTVFYSVAIFGLYLTDTYHFGRRPPNRPVPTN